MTLMVPWCNAPTQESLCVAQLASAFAFSNNTRYFYFVFKSLIAHERVNQVLDVNYVKY